MPLTTAQLAQMRTELTTDPNGYDYNAAGRNDSDMAAKINAVRDGTNGAAIPVRRADVAVADVYAAVSVADYTALPGTPTAAQLSAERRYLAWFSGLAAMGRIRLLNDDGSDTPVVANFKAMFAAGTGTLTRLAALASRSGSRAEQLFGSGVVVTIDDVGRALNT